MASQPVETSDVGSSLTLAAQDDFRCWEARMHFNPTDPTSCAVVRALRVLSTKIGRAGCEALTMLFSCLRVVLDPTDNQKLLSVELVLPCFNAEKVREAEQLLNPERPPDPRANRYNDDGTLRQKKKKEGSPSPQQLALPKFLNSYRLAEVLPAVGEVPLRLRFVIALAYNYVLNKGPRAGQTVRDISVISATTLQRLITTYLPAPLLPEIAWNVRNGLAQELAQALLSHLGLKEEGSQGEVGVASMVSSDPRLAKQQRIPFKRQPLRFVTSNDVVVYRRDWEEHGQVRTGFYAALTLGQSEWSERNLWWRRRLAEFTPLPLWSDHELKPRQKVLMLPLAIRADHCFVAALSDSQWQPCWSLVVPRGAEWFLQLITKRRIEPVSRPNVLGIHFAQVPVAGGHQTTIYWSLFNLVNNQVGERGEVVVDLLPAERPWPSRAERKRLSYRAARHIVSLALTHNADLAVEEVSGVKKRGRDADANALATRFNYSDLATRIGHKANDVAQPVAVWPVNSWLLKDNKELPHQQQADLVALAGLALRSKKKK